MNNNERLQAFSLDDLATTRMLQLYVYSRDRDASNRTTGRPQKNSHLAKIVNATIAWAKEQELPERLRFLAELQDSKTLTKQLSTALRSQASHLHPASAVPVLLEAYSSLSWPKGTSWAADQPYKAMAAAAKLLGPTTKRIDTRDLLARHKSAFKRLRKDSISPTAQVGIGAFMAGTAVLSGGAVNAVGTVIGTHLLGYSGAAATSAGLAWLGGGSLAAGGFGMAGGTLLINIAAQTARASGKYFLGTIIAKESAPLFAQELAKLDVRVQFDPTLEPELVRSLRKLKKALAAELTQIKPPTSDRAERVWGHLKRMANDPLEIGRHSKDLWREVPDAEERNLAASIRAIDYELRHLTSPEWKRQVARIPRLVGIPKATRLLDFIED